MTSKNYIDDVKKAAGLAGIEGEYGIESAETDNAIFRFGSFELETWAEHEHDIRFQVVPPEKRIAFDLEPNVKAKVFGNRTEISVREQNSFIGVQLERIIKREFKDKRVRASVHGWEYGERIARNCDITQLGMTLFDITIFEGYSAYRVVERLVKGIAQLDKILRGEEPILET